MTTQKYSADILQEISPENIPRLLEALKKDWPQSVTISHTIKTFVEWKRKDPELDAYILTPNGTWKNGTVVCIAQFVSFRIAIYSCEESSEEILKCLQETERIEWKSQNLLFLCVHERFSDSVLEVIRSKNVTNIIQVKNTTYWITDEQASNMHPELSPDVYVAPLDVSHARLINDSWPHRSDTSQVFIEHLLRASSCNVGVFARRDSQLVAWVLDADYGVGLLATAPSHRRLGLARQLLRCQCRALRQLGKHICLHIVDGNEPSHRLFQSLGAEKLNRCSFIAVNSPSGEQAGGS